MHESFGKYLASVDKKVRDGAVTRLVDWIRDKKDISDLDLLKLWKGLFYCFWLSDKAPVQEHLAGRLAGILLSLDEDLAFRFLKAFWTIIGLEWHGIDRLRLDKYYMLLRKFALHSFQLLESLGWSEDAINLHSEILSSGPLSINDSKIPDSLRYHVTDAFLDELKKSEVEQSTHNKVWMDKVQTIFTTLASSGKEEDEEDAEETTDPFKINMQEIGEAMDAISKSNEVASANRLTCFKLRKLYLGDAPMPDIQKSRPVGIMNIFFKLSIS
ncbi:hypothetical protein HDU67_005293 [Dinochytrium kinnereticum]|nr:hypothetical protein HDU67_005293 [Dinochytrium kinnereticum]